MSAFAVGTDYEYNATHKRELLTVWSHPFASVYEATAVALPKGDGYMLTTYNGDRVRVTCPTPRNDANYSAVDKAISDALTAHYAAIGASRLVEL